MTNQASISITHKSVLRFIVAMILMLIAATMYSLPSESAGLPPSSTPIPTSTPHQDEANSNALPSIAIIAGNLRENNTSNSVNTVLQEVILEVPTQLQYPYNNGCWGSGWERYVNNRGHYAYLTLNTNDLAQSTNWAEWRVTLPVTGQWRVYAYIPTHEPIPWPCLSNQIIWGDTIEARYQVFYHGGSTVTSRNQLPLNNQWLEIGAYTFSSSQEARIRLGDLNSQPNLKETVSVSAMRFVYEPPPPTTPNPPSNIQASDGTYSDKVRVTWGGVSNASTYIIYRNTSDSSTGRIQLGTTSSTTYDDASAQAGQIYYYWVRAQNSVGTSNYSSSNSGYRANPAPTGKTLNVRYVDQVFAQQTSAGGYWILCGPSSAAMLLHYKGLETRDVFTNRQATRDLCGMMNQYGTGTCYSGLTWHQPMINVLRNKGLNVFARYTKPTFAEIKQSIDRNNPIIMGLNIGHLVLVVGYDNTNQQIIVHDPFGRKSWWNESHNWWQGATNMPHTGSPKTVGRNIAYTYSEFSPLISSSFFVQGSLSAIPATMANWNSTLESGNVSIQLGNALAHTLGNIQQATFEPLLMPSSDVLNYHGTWESFILSAVDSNGQPVHSASDPFTVNITFDVEWLDGLRVETGVVSESGLQQLSHKEVDVSAIHWDNTTQAWVEIDSHIDIETGVISFESYAFGEYALAFTANNQIYLPVVVR